MLPSSTPNVALEKTPLQKIEQEMTQVSKNFEDLNRQQTDLLKKLGKIIVHEEDRVEQDRLKQEFELTSNRLTNARSYRSHLLERKGLLEEQAHYQALMKSVVTTSTQRGVIEEQQHKLQKRIDQHQRSQPPTI